MDLYSSLNIPAFEDWTQVISKVRFLRRTTVPEKPSTPVKVKKPEKKRAKKQLSISDLQEALRDELLKNPEALLKTMKEI